MSINYDTCTKEELIESHKQLIHELAQIKRMLYGAKSERFIPASPPDQLRLSFGKEEESEQGAQKVETQIIERATPKKGKQPFRQELTAHYRGRSSN